MLGGGCLGQRSVVGIPLAAGVESHQSHQPREPAEVDVDDETGIAQRTGTHPGQRPDIQRLEHWVRGEPIARLWAVAEVDRFTVHQYQVDLGVRDTGGLDDIFHGLVCMERPELRRVPRVRVQEVVQLGIHAQFHDAAHTIIVGRRSQSQSRPGRSCARQVASTRQDSSRAMPIRRQVRFTRGSSLVRSQPGPPPFFAGQLRPLSRVRWLPLNQSIVDRGPHKYVDALTPADVRTEFGD